MASVIKNMSSVIAHMAGVKAAAHDKGREIQARAEANFAPHNRPGGHEIKGVRQDTDYLVVLEGPIPEVVEFGRAGFEQTRKDGSTRHIGPMEGLHVLGKAANL